MFSLPKQVQQQNVIFCYQNLVTETHYMLPNFDSKMYYFTTNKNLVAHELSGKIFCFPPMFLLQKKVWQQNNIFCYQNLIAETYILLPNFGSKIQYFVTKKILVADDIKGEIFAFLKMFLLPKCVWQQTVRLRYQNLVAEIYITLPKFHLVANDISGKKFDIPPIFFATK